MRRHKFVPAVRRQRDWPADRRPLRLGSGAARIGGAIFNPDGLRLKMLVLFRRSREQESVRERGFSLSDLGDDVGAAEPVSFSEIGG